MLMRSVKQTHISEETAGSHIPAGRAWHWQVQAGGEDSHQLDPDVLAVDLGN